MILKKLHLSISDIIVTVHSKFILFKKMSVFVLLFLMIIFGCSGNVYKIYELEDTDENYKKWINKEHGLKNDLVTATVIGETSNTIYVYIDNIYVGDHGEEVTTCGGVISKDKDGKWSCSPTGVKIGRGFVVLRLSLLHSVKKVVCSDEIYFNLYDRRGQVFYKKEIPYKKKWSNYKENIVGSFKSFFKVCK